MKTKKYIEMLTKAYDPEEELAIPFIWCKGDVEEMFEVEISVDDWHVLAQDYMDDERLCDDSFATMSDLVAIKFKEAR